MTFQLDPKVDGTKCETNSVCFNFSETVLVSETGNDSGSTPAITAAALVAGLALVVLVVMVAALMWRKIRRRQKFKPK